MIHTKCKSCGTALSNIEYDYRTKLNKICNDNKNSDQTKEKLVSELINSYQLSMCCNTVLLTSVNLTELIIPSSDQ